MNQKIKKILYWMGWLLLFIVGPSLNLMLNKGIPLNQALERLLIGPLPVRAYLVLLALLSFVCGELVLTALQSRNMRWALWPCLVLLIGWLVTRYDYFLLLVCVCLVDMIVVFVLGRRKQDAIHEVLEAVMANETESAQEEAVEESEEPAEVYDEPEISIEPEPTLDDLQQREIELFLDSLFEKSTLPAVKEEPLDEPFAREILSDANELLEVASAVEPEEIIKKEPPKEVVLKKKAVEPPDDLLEAELSKEEEPLGEFDEEIPLDDFVEESVE